MVITYKLLDSAQKDWKQLEGFALRAWQRVM